ncbi:restriction endonuclease [Paracoccus cavernae]|uniref:Restriction endonuclease n=2 Tax=Paracoccus cavernae TaxID=1571207 RepID=A0ABT8DAX7_9RHOB|nr:restriction endonuclease [Paracoccus cavernae]
MVEVETPEERIETAYMQLDGELADDLLELILSLTPARFEQLIVELLLAMGYGDGRSEMGQAIGKSGDGGIDGVVNEDKLGLDAVYIQAKRYALDNTVGRPALQAFIGSMTGESATKGVFVTTSTFSKEAREYIRRVQQRVVLIDGKRLARLMIDHGVGVKADKTYVLRSIDANFFDVV